MSCSYFSVHCYLYLKLFFLFKLLKKPEIPCDIHILKHFYIIYLVSLNEQLLGTKLTGVYCVHTKIVIHI